MTTLDYITVGGVGMVLLGLFLTAKKAEQDGMRYHLSLRLGVDDFLITHQAENGDWLILSGGDQSMEMCEIGDFIYIEQLTGPRYSGRITSIAVSGEGQFAIRLERVK